MKKVIIGIVSFISFSLQAQTLNMESNAIEERVPLRTITIEPSKSEENNPVSRWTCVRSEGSWDGECYHIYMTCSQGAHTINMGIESCAYSIIQMGPDLSNNPKNKLLNVNVKYFPENVETATDVVNLQTYKNGTFEIVQDAYYKGKEGNIVVKAGTYKITNSKLHTLMSIK